MTANPRKMSGYMWLAIGIVGSGDHGLPIGGRLFAFFILVAGAFLLSIEEAP